MARIAFLIYSTVFLIAAIGSVRAQSIDGHPDWPGAGQFFVGTCYQPVDRMLKR
jgi:beta-galactosidase